ncbi:hypothetical protein KUCAC02_014140 [Chaenocephalus aceratus]|uniref:Uncharacterized protein n=1 Tax=Chaenocephalus aceratus TaxID=36190 RepID=A0ACB9WCX2_CHAAC|nr:hypothetical protein KUCAC02_014140 [Chaenocephalus aceratus]
MLMLICCFADSITIVSDVLLSTLQKELSFKVQIFEKKVEEYKKWTLKLSNSVEYVKYQAEQAERQIKAEFERLHKALVAEEALCLNALSDDEGQKIATIQGKIDKVNEDIKALKALSETLKKEMSNDDLPLLKVRGGTK